MKYSSVVWNYPFSTSPYDHGGSSEHFLNGGWLHLPNWVCWLWNVPPCVLTYLGTEHSRDHLEFQVGFPVERAHCTLMPNRRPSSFVPKMWNNGEKKELVQAKTQISLASEKTTTGSWFFDVFKQTEKTENTLEWDWVNGRDQAGIVVAWINCLHSP